MSRVGRLAGSLLVETEGAYFLVGHRKRPCDFAAAGFEPPAGEIDPAGPSYLPLRRSGPLAVPGPWLLLPLEGEALLRLLGERLVISRTNSVSDRLWRLVFGAGPDDDVAAGSDLVLEAGWLVTMPAPIWQIVRDTVLRCT